MKYLQVISALVVCALLMSGCAAEAEPSALVSPSAAPTASATPAPTPISTPIPTTPPDVTETPTETPKPSETAEPDATPKQTDKPAAEEKTEIADGFSYMKLSDEIKNRITGMSYPADDSDSAISYDDLRYIKIKHYDFSGNVKDGELIVNKKLAKEVAQIFYELYQAKYPLESVRLVDDYGEPGDDNLSMAANNTSAFNYRKVTGSKKLSRHSYGAAIDINPRLNPYIDGNRIAPENGAEYADRSKYFAGKIDHDDACYKIFTEHGWTWGGDWKGDKDYQHFSKDIGFKG